MSFTPATHYVTAGAGPRMSAFAQLDREHRVGFGVVGVSYMPTDIVLGGLDAPEQMPAGAMNSTEWKNGRGESIPYTNLVVRGV